MQSMKSMIDGNRHQLITIDINQLIDIGNQ